MACPQSCPSGARRAKPAKSPGMGPGFIALNRGKKSVTLDLKGEADKQVMRDLLADADVFIHNVRAAPVERLGFGYEAVKALNPAIEVVGVETTGFPRAIASSSATCPEE